MILLTRPQVFLNDLSSFSATIVRTAVHMQEEHEFTNIFTFRHVEAREKEFPVSYTTLAISCIRYHRCYQIPNEGKVCHQFLCWHTCCKSTQCLIVCLKDSDAIVIQAVQQFAEDHRDIIVEICFLFP